MILNLLLIAMISALLIPIYAVCKDYITPPQPLKNLEEKASLSPNQTDKVILPLGIKGGDHIWQKMLALSSIATKTSILVLVISVLRDDWAIGIVGVIVLSVGNAGLMLLAHIIKRLNQVESPPIRNGARGHPL